MCAGPCGPWSYACRFSREYGVEEERTGVPGPSASFRWRAMFLADVAGTHRPVPPPGVCLDRVYKGQDE